MSGTISRVFIQCRKEPTWDSMITSACATADWRASMPSRTVAARSSMVYRNTSSISATSASMSRGTARSTMNIGRWRRARTVRSIVPLPMIGSELAVQEMMMSYSGKRSGRSRSSIASALKRRARDSARSSVRLATAMPRGCCHRDDVGADSGVAAHLLRHRERALEEFVEERSECAGGLGDADRLLHLAQDLRFADHHGVEAGGDAERVPHRFAVREGVEIRLQLLRLDAVIAGEPLERGLRFAQRTVELGAIARRKDCDFLDRLALSQLRKRRSKAIGLKHHPLADRKRSGLEVQSEGEKLHGESGLRNMPL